MRERIADLLQKIVDLITDFLESLKTEPDDDTPDDPPIPELPDGATIWAAFCQKLAVSTVIPDVIKPAVLAQAIIESGRGQSPLARTCLNFHGMKWRSEMQGIATPQTMSVTSEVTGQATFCRFRNIDNAIAGYWHFLHRDPYAGVGAHIGSSDDFLAFIGPIWCPPGYTAEWIRKHSGHDYDDYCRIVLFPEAMQTLAKYGWDAPRPGREEMTGRVWIPYAEDFYPRMPTQGKYPDAYPQGAVIHFTAGSTLRSSMEYGRKQGYAFLGIDYNGKVYQGNSLDKWGYHSGTEHHRRLVGIEIACAGTVTKQPSGTFKSWFGSILPAEKVRIIHERTANQFPAAYAQYTPEQEAALIELLMWMKANNPSVFDFDKVIGHDEACIEAGFPGRKTDPGGAFSMTMPAFREYLKDEWRNRHG